MIQDTAWAGYEEIPIHIMQGYFSLLTEILSQAPKVWPTHIFVQTGVGSLAAAILAHVHSFSDRPKPVFATVEAHGAPCFYNSMQTGDGNPHKVCGDLNTIMAGLACGLPSTTAWEILSAGSDAFISCDDDIAKSGMRILGNPLGNDTRIVSGESGAVSLGLIYTLLHNDAYQDIKEELKLDKNSKILLFSTEGDTDPDHYRQIVW